MSTGPKSPRAAQPDRPDATDAAGKAATDDWAIGFARADTSAELNAALALATSVERTLRVSRALAEAGRAIDLTGLENWVGRLTASTLDLEPAQGRQMRPVLAALCEALDRLEHAVTARAPPR